MLEAMGALAPVSNRSGKVDEELWSVSAQASRLNFPPRGA